jgi:hypothetical protein
MKRLTDKQESATIPRDYFGALSKLFARSPDEIEAQQGLISAPESTQTAPAVSMPHLPKRKQP